MHRAPEAELDVVVRMKDFTVPSLTPLYGVISHETGRLLGSGTFISIGGRSYILTAAHVVEDSRELDASGLRKYECLAHDIGQGQLAANIVDKWYAYTGPRDLALTPLDGILGGSEYIPLDFFHVLAPSTNDLGSDLLFVHGWPGKSSYSSSLLGNMIYSKSRPHAGWPTTSKDSFFNEEIHLAITYSPEGLIDEQGQPTEFIPPSGMSGSLLWKTNREGAGSLWEPNMAQVIGIVTRWDPDSHCLIATRAEYIRGFIEHALEQTTS